MQQIQSAQMLHILSVFLEKILSEILSYLNKTTYFNQNAKYI